MTKFRTAASRIYFHIKSGGKDDGQVGALRKALMHAAQPDESADGCTKIVEACAEDSLQVC